MFSKIVLAAALAATPAIAAACEFHAGLAAETAIPAEGKMASGSDHSHDHDHGDMAMDGKMPMLMDAYARAATPNARAGAAFGMIMNPSDVDDRLIAARSDVAARIELHTHVEGDDGMMMMREVEGGFAIPAGGSHAMKRGGDHIMFMGLKESFTQGKEIPITLVFEKAGEIETAITVDLERRDEGMHGGMDHSGHSHGASN